MSKSEFIRTRPAGMTAKEVVAAAAVEGMILSEHFVYNIRSSAKKKASRAPAAAVPEAARAVVGRAGSRETSFRRLALDLGIDRAKRLIAEVEAKLTALIGGR